MWRYYSVYLSLVIFFLGAVYIIVFGDSGYWVRNDLKKQITNLENNIEDMKQENDLLYKKHQLVKKGLLKSSIRGDKLHLLEPGAVVLKFEGQDENIGDSKKYSEFSFSSTTEEFTLLEARILYVVSALLFCLIGMYVMGTLYKRDEKQGRDDSIFKSNEDSLLIGD